ncbi:MAG: hypothetical protein ACOYIR_04070 [Christensenellales bacterium]|jgi:hypothetical protein
MKGELREIIAKFAESGWELIAEPSKRWLNGDCSKEELLKAVSQADRECGNCGCEFDPLYKKVLGSQALL